MLNGRVGQVIGPFSANEDLLETNGAIGTFTPETTKPILYKLGIQAPEGTRVQINEATIQIGKTGIYELRCGNLKTKRAIMDQRDLVNALMLLADKGKAGDVYNVSSENIYQMEDIVKMIEVILNKH